MREKRNRLDVNDFSKVMGLPVSSEGRLQIRSSAWLPTLQVRVLLPIAAGEEMQQPPGVI